MKGISKSDTTIVSDLTSLGAEGFRTRLAEYADYVTLKVKELDDLKKALRKSKLEDLMAEKFSLAEVKVEYQSDDSVFA